LLTYFEYITYTDMSLFELLAAKCSGFSKFWILREKPDPDSYLKSGTRLGKKYFKVNSTGTVSFLLYLRVI
jgi:hypothetical protein